MRWAQRSTNRKPRSPSQIYKSHAGMTPLSERSRSISIEHHNSVTEFDRAGGEKILGLDRIGRSTDDPIHPLARNLRSDLNPGSNRITWDRSNSTRIARWPSLGATGLAQATELVPQHPIHTPLGQRAKELLLQVWHLHGWATNRSKPHTRYCLQHNLGLGGAVVVTMYCRLDKSQAPSQSSLEQGTVGGKVEDGRKWAGYNPAVEARWVSDADVEAVKSRIKPSLKMLEGRQPFRGARL